MGIGFLEIVVIGIAALVLLGPQRLPEIMRHVAKFYVQIRRTSNDFKSAFDHVVHEAEIASRKEEITRLGANLKTSVFESKDVLASTFPARHETQSTTSDLPGLRPESPFGWDQPPARSSDNQATQSQEQAP